MNDTTTWSAEQSGGSAGARGWAAVCNANMPPLDEIVWLWDGKTIWIGGRADDCDGWLWGNTYGHVWHNGQKWDGELETDDDYKPTHWMRLPEPPNRGAERLRGRKAMSKTTKQTTPPRRRRTAKQFAPATGYADGGDRRSEAAKARDEWLDSPEGTSAQNAATLGTAAPNYYLRNRLERAFLAGMEAARRLQGGKRHTDQAHPTAAGGTDGAQRKDSNEI